VREVLVATQALADRARVAQAHDLGADVALDADAEALVVRADPTRLRQCLLNVVGNAIKYNRPGGQVQVSARVAADGRVALAVRDDGIGMDAQQRERLFQPFDRLGREAMGPGAGLGLLLTRQLLQAMGGDLQVDSAPGAGSTFTLWLPAGAAARGAGSEASPGPR
jgi:signal transduction histidine kinase